MDKFLQLLPLAMSFLPWIEKAESIFAAPNSGDQKKSFVLSAIDAGSQALMSRFGVPQGNIEGFQALAGEAVDLAVHIAHWKGIFGIPESDPIKAVNVTQALGQKVEPQLAAKAVAQLQAASKPVPDHLTALAAKASA